MARGSRHLGATDRGELSLGRVADAGAAGLEDGGVGEVAHGLGVEIGDRDLDRLGDLRGGGEGVEEGERRGRVENGQKRNGGGDKDG